MAMGVLGLATLGGILVTDLFSWREVEQLAQPEVQQGPVEPVSELSQWNYTAKPGNTVSPKTKTKTK